EQQLKKDRDKSVAIWLRVALMRLDAKAINDANLMVVARKMKGNDLDLRIQAARAIGYIGYAARMRVPELIEALKDDEPRMVSQVCWSLARMGDAAEKAIPALEALQSHKDAAVRESAKSAIAEIKKAVDLIKKNPAKK